MEIVTGSTGEVHVTPIDDAVRNSNVSSLSQRFVFTYLQNFAATIVTNNEVRIGSGYGSNQGRIFKIDKDEFDSVTIENGSQGYKRADLIVARYTINTQTGFEDISLQVIRGSSGNTYVDPSYSTGNINQGATQDDMPLYRVKLNGLLIEAVERMFTLVPDGGRLGQLESIVNAHQTAFNALNFRTNLESESAIYPKNGANVRPGVEGILPVAHGGTGQTSLKNAANSLVGSIDTNGTTPGDSEQYIGTTSGVTGYQKKPLSTLWSYIRGKIENILGMTTDDVVPVNHGGTGKTSIGAKKVLVGNAQGTAFEEWMIDDAPNSSNSDHFVTSKGVADAMGRAGYGDMMKATYDPNEDGIIDITQGGTGTTSLQSLRNNMGLGNTTGALPIANGGTGAATAALARNNLGLGNTTGALPIANGGTGLTASPSILTNLGSTSAANVMQASPRPGVTGNLPITNGGTGATTAASARTNLGVPPTSHASSATIYGVGTESNYGHLKITDTYNQIGTAYKAASGMAASASAVGTVYSALGDTETRIMQSLSLIDHEVEGKMDKSGGTFTGNVVINHAGDISRMTLGNNVVGSATASTTSGGELRIYNRGSGNYSQLRFENDKVLTTNKGMYVPLSTGTIQVADSSSRRIKENIKGMSEERARKLLGIEIVNFDYIDDFGNGKKDQSGVIAEDAAKVIPEAVHFFEGYDENKPINDEKNPSPEVDYRKYIPYLIKMVQMQQKEIDELKAALK